MCLVVWISCGEVKWVRILSWTTWLLEPKISSLTQVSHRWWKSAHNHVVVSSDQESVWWTCMSRHVSSSIYFLSFNKQPWRDYYVPRQGAKRGRAGTPQRALQLGVTGRWEVSRGNRGKWEKNFNYSMCGKHCIVLAFKAHQDPKVGSTLLSSTE